MPRKMIKSRGGAVKYRTIRRGGRVITVAIVRKPGPRGGRTVGMERRA